MLEYLRWLLLHLVAACVIAAAVMLGLVRLTQYYAIPYMTYIILFGLLFLIIYLKTWKCEFLLYRCWKRMKARIVIKKEMEEDTV